MPLTYESTHEYYFKDPSLYFCKEHNCLRVTEGHQDSVLIAGVSEDDIDTFIKYYSKYIKKTNENLENHNHSKDAAEA